MFSAKDFLTGLGVGAGLMYWFDPARGRYRRSKLRDQIIHSVHQTDEFINRGVRDLRNRMQGVQHDMGALFSHDHADDRIIEQRVRAKMGRHVSHPHAIEVRSWEGHVTVRGAILACEVEGFLDAVASVRGVRSVDNQLSVHESAEGISSLQGPGTLQGEPHEFMQENWAPATRLLASGLGAGLMLNCLARRTPTAILWATLGFGLFVRAVSNLPVRRLTGVGAGRQAVTIHRAFHIDAPVEKVFNFITDWRQSARFMPHVVDIEDLGMGQFRWRWHIPGAGDVQIEDEITQLEPNRLIAWRSTRNSPLAFEGRARFHAEEENRTLIDVWFSYNPPAGAAGHAAARLVGWDPKTQMEQSYIRIKSYLETGKMPHDIERQLRRENEQAVS